MNASKMEPKKGTNMVGTFLNGDCIGSSESVFKRAIDYAVVSEFVEVPATKEEPEKVAITVATFLNDGFNN
jgi:hypothetical protein